MEIIANDKSFIGQFDEQKFILYCKNELIPIFKELNKQNVSILKSYSTYSRLVTQDISLEVLLRTKGNFFIDNIRHYLIQLTREPFWEDNTKTDFAITYPFDENDIPNCITEAMARKATLFSFKQGGYDNRTIEVLCGKEKSFINNFSTFEQCQSILAELGMLIVWGDSNSFNVKSLGYKFEIRFNEGHHNIAHFHMSNADEEVVISIPDADVLEGRSKNVKKIISWALDNMQHIKKLWNKYHPEMLV